MKKISKILMSAALTAMLGSVAWADGNAFTPLDFDKTTTSTVTTNAVNSTGEAVGNEDIQNAILQLDNAQIGIRNDLINYKAKYADVDAQYKLIKNERSVLKKQVNSIEKRLKNIERSKEKLRKDMV